MSKKKREQRSKNQKFRKQYDEVEYDFEKDQYANW